MPGYTQSVFHNLMVNPTDTSPNINTPAFVLMRATDANPRMDFIRSFTVGNDTTDVIVGVYPRPQANGLPHKTIPPGANVTLPIAACTVLAFAFFPQSWPLNASDIIYLHIDSEALAASGFYLPPSAAGPSVLPGT